MDIYGHIRTYMDIFEHIRTSTDIYGHIWTYMNIHEHIPALSGWLSLPAAGFGDIKKMMPWIFSARILSI